MSDFKFITIKMAKQYGDTFLFDVMCPFCNKQIFQPFPFNFCDECESDLSDFEAEIGNYSYKCVSGSKRKKQIGVKKIKYLYQQQEGLCAYCSCKLDTKMEVEHIKPLACGGTNNMDNLCLACKECNRIASSKWFDSFYSKMKYILQKRKMGGQIEVVF